MEPWFVSTLLYDTKQVHIDDGTSELELESNSHYLYILH